MTPAAPTPNRSTRRSTRSTTQAAGLAHRALPCLLPLLGTPSLCGAGSNPSAAASAQAAGPGRGFPLDGPWVSYYGQAPGIDLGRVAATFRIINIDADPSRANFTPAQIEGL